MNQVQTINQKKKRKGFTLIELIIVLAVMAIIAAIAIPNISGVKKNAAIKADQQSAETIKRAIDVLIADGTIIPVNGKSFTIAEGGVVEATKGEEALGKNGAEALGEAIKGIKKPSEQGKTKYSVPMTSDGVGKITTIE